MVATGDTVNEAFLMAPCKPYAHAHTIMVQKSVVQIPNVQLRPRMYSSMLLSLLKTFCTFSSASATGLSTWPLRPHFTTWSTAIHEPLHLDAAVCQECLTSA